MRNLHPIFVLCKVEILPNFVAFSEYINFNVLFFFIYLNRIRKEFLDAEAELSGSEGSDDEDERGLDKLLVEEGDLDDIDIDEVRYSNCLSIDLNGKKN